MNRQEKIKENHKKTKKISKRAKVVSSIDRSQKVFEPLFDVKYRADIQGWYKKLELIASKEGSWVDSLESKTIVTLEYFDGDIVLQLNYRGANQKIEIPLDVLHNIAIAAEVLNKMEDGHVFTKVKMKTQKKRP